MVRVSLLLVLAVVLDSLSLGEAVAAVVHVIKEVQRGKISQAELLGWVCLAPEGVAGVGAGEAGVEAEVGGAGLRLRGAARQAGSNIIIISWRPSFE